MKFKIFEIVWRWFAILLSLAIIGGAIFFCMQTPLNITYLLILYGAAYLLSLSTVVRWARRKSENSSGTAKFFAYFLLILLNAVIAPITLIISIFGRTTRLHNLNDYAPSPFDENDGRSGKKAEKNSREEKMLEREKLELERDRIRLERLRVQNEAKMLKLEIAGAKSANSPKARKARNNATAEIDPIYSNIRSSVWRASSKQAIAKILDENYTGDVKVDNGYETKVFNQVALIKISGRQYALLSPKYSSDENYGTAVAYAIAPDAATGENTLKLVEDEGLYRKIFAVYETLLAENQMA